MNWLHAASMVTAILSIIAAVVADLEGDDAKSAKFFAAACTLLIVATLV